jgi:glycosyltransferase involved in cell wall biosynthesis
VLGPRTDIAALLADHHLFILPSRGGEGLPKALLEAAAAGRPALVSDVPGCRDFVVDGETGFIAPPENGGALTAALLHAATADLAAMGLKARQRVGETASVEAVAGTVVGVYRQLVGAAPGSG